MSKIRQKKVIQKMIENDGNVSKAMKESGYSENYARNPQNLVKTKSFQELMDEVFPDNYLLDKHRELLEKKETIRNWKGNEVKVIRTDEPDAVAVKAGLEMAYKLKGSFAAERKSHEFPQGVPILPLNFIEGDENEKDEA